MPPKTQKKQLKFTTSPTEKTTAITDILLSSVAAGGIYYLQQLESPENWKINAWCMALGFIALSGLLGASAHGIEMSEKVPQRIWNLLNLSLGLAVSVFVIGVAYDMWGLAVARAILPWIVVLALGFYLVTRLFAGIFFVFIVYEAVALVFAWGAYSGLALTGQLKGALLMSVGVLMSIIAAGIQATLKTTIELIFEFDNNGIFHIVQILGIVLLLTGLRLSLLSH
jgi:hypothetical protein